MENERTLKLSELINQAVRKYLENGDMDVWVGYETTQESAKWIDVINHYEDGELKFIVGGD